MLLQAALGSDKQLFPMVQEALSWNRLSIDEEYSMIALKKRLTTSTVAMLLVLNAHAYAEEKGKEVSRYRFTRATLKKISGRQRLRDAFLDDLTEMLEELNWTLIIRDTDFGLLDLSKTDSWPRLNSHRIAAYREFGSDELANLYREKLEISPDNDEEGEYA